MSAMTSVVFGFTIIIGVIGIMVGLGFIVHWLEMPRPRIEWFTAGVVLGVAVAIMLGLVIAERFLFSEP
jgi:hypothetical protein